MASGSEGILDIFYACEKQHDNHRFFGNLWQQFLHDPSLKNIGIHGAIQ